MSARPLYRSTLPLSVSSDLRVLPWGVETHQCAACGHTFSHAGQFPPELETIYRGYRIYTEAPDTDHVVFNVAGETSTRTQLEMQVLERFFEGTPSGRFLDVGCNKGLMLRAFSRRFPAWEIHGHEVSAHHFSALGDVLTPQTFHCGALEDIRARFDFITILHTLEHVHLPRNFLLGLRGLLSPKGCLMIQVPDMAANPADLLVYDHLSHFQLDTLVMLVESAGLHVLESGRPIPRELTVICTAGSGVADADERLAEEAVTELRERSEEAVRFLARLEQCTMAVHETIGVFGTGLLGTWVGGLLGKHLGFFVDESPWKRGTRHLDTPVFHPDDLTGEDQVLMAVTPDIQRRIADRLGPHIRVIVP